MNIRVAYEQSVQKYEWKGRNEFLALDGAVDHQVWDEAVLGSTREDRQEWIKSVHDPRLQALNSGQGGAEPADLASTLGQSWKANQKHFVLGNPEGSHQRVEFGPMGRSGGDFKLVTVASNADVGRMEHTISAGFTFGEINKEQIKEELKLEG